MGHAATHRRACASWRISSPGAVQLGFCSKPHSAFSLAVFSVFWAASRFTFLLKGNKSKGHLVLLIPLPDILPKKEINTFLRILSWIYLGNKSSVSSLQSWVSSVHWCCNPTAPASQGNRVRSQGPQYAAALLAYGVWLQLSGLQFAG